MEASEICNLYISELVTSAFCAQWSEDNHLMIETDKGIHVFELQPNPLCPNPTPKFKRTFLYPTDYLPAEKFSSIINDVINNCNRRNMYSLLMDSAITPKLNDKSDHLPRIISTSWSSSGLIKPSRCLLATLTSAGAIDLCLKFGKDWLSVSNISSLWWNIVENELDFDTEKCNVNEVTADLYLKNIRRLQATSITWSPLQNDSNTCYCFLVTAFRSGDLVIWRIDSIPELGSNFSPQIVYRMRSEPSNIRITNLLWVTLSEKNHVIFLGYNDGRIHGQQIENDNGNLKEHSLIKYEEYSDKMSITSIHSKKKLNGGTHIFVTQNSFVVLMILDLEGKLLEKLHIQLLGFTITGAVLIDEDRIIVTTQDAAIHSVALKESKLTSSRIFHDMKSSKVQYLGLARSPSEAVFLNVTSPNILHDHLINREPSCLQLFHFKEAEMDPSWILNSSEDNLHKYWDCLETIRIKAAKSSESENHFPKIIEPLETLSIHKLRIIMWLTLISDVLKTKKVIKKIDNIVGEISEAQPLIFIHSASSHLIKLSEKKVWNDDHRLSIHFLRLYLEIFLAGEDEGKSRGDNNNQSAISRAEEAIQKTSEIELIEAEPCNLCGEIVTELPSNISNCPQGHYLPRCALTLLQITCLKYRSCPVCSRIYHPSLDEDYPEIRCLYCDIPTTYDIRVIGVNDDLEEKCKSLSLRPAWETKTQPEAEGSHEKRTKKRKIDEDAVKVIVNKENTIRVVVNKKKENITETWQEL